MGLTSLVPASMELVAGSSVIFHLLYDCTEFLFVAKMLVLVLPLPT